MKRLVVAKTILIGIRLIERGTLLTSFEACSCPMTERVSLLRCPSRLTGTPGNCVPVFHKDRRIVLLTSTDAREIRSKDLEIPPPRCDIVYLDSSSRSDSRGSLAQVVLAKWSVR